MKPLQVWRQVVHFPAAVAAGQGHDLVRVGEDKDGKNIQATIGRVVALLTVGYMLPWAIAASRGKSNAG